MAQPVTPPRQSHWSVTFSRHHKEWTMTDYLEILERSNTGEYSTEENWDLEKVATTARRLVKKYRLEWDRNQVVCDDPSLADAIYQAGYEMAVDFGAYSRSTERIITQIGRASCRERV